MASGRWSQFYPVDTKLLALFDGHWELVPHRENRLKFLQDLLRDPRHASLEMHLRQPTTMSGLEIRLGHRSAFDPWIVPELYVHR